MKKVVLGFMAIAISFASIAQGKSEDHKKHQKGDKKEFRHKDGRELSKDMNLTEDQKTRLKSINENFRTQVQNLRADKSLSEEAQRERKRTLQQEHRSQILSLLTPEQKKQWEEKKKNHDFEGKDGKKFNRKDKSARQSK